jgi:hypothetical protein
MLKVATYEKNNKIKKEIKEFKRKIKELKELNIQLKENNLKLEYIKFMTGIDPLTPEELTSAAQKAFDAYQEGTIGIDYEY